MTFAWPWALLGLASLPALVLLYWLRARAPRRPVSSLLLWTGAPHPASGRRFERFEAPLLFLLELSILLLLVAAAVGPRRATPAAAAPLAVILDDSLSMRAGGEDSPRRRALRAVAEIVNDDRWSGVRLVAAGVRPRLLAEELPPERVRGALDAWECAAPSANLESAVVLARELGGARTRVLVVTDHAPPTGTAIADLRWRAFGAARANVGLPTAVRSDREVLVEAAAWAEGPVRARLSVEAGGRTPREELLVLAPDEPLRRRFEVDGDSAVRLTLRAADGADAFPADDAVDLLPPARRPVRVDLRLAPGPLRASVEAALEAGGRVRFTADAPELVVGPGETEPGAWRVRFEPGADPRAFVGPFVLDHRHPLVDGLSLGGVLWAAERADAPADAAVPVAAGDVPLILDRELPDGGRELVLRLDPERSTVQRSPAWPVLWWNLAELRAAAAPGPRRVNLRLGEEVEVALPAGARTLAIEGPDGRVRTTGTEEATVQILPEGPGLHELRAGDATWRIAVALGTSAESDLREATSGDWGAWESSEEAATALADVSWAPALAALALLGIHLAVASGGPGRRRGEEG